MMDVGKLGDIQSNQQASNVHVGQTEARELKKQKNFDEMALSEKEQLSSSRRERRQEVLREKGEVSSEKTELERQQTPSSEQTAPRRGEDGFRDEQTQGGIDIQA
jgi:hypothetical protein